MPSATVSSLRPTQLPDIELHCPMDLVEVLLHLSDGASVLAGRTDMVLWASQSRKPTCLVWTGGVEELLFIDLDGEFVRVGAAVTLSSLGRPLQKFSCCSNRCG